MKNRYEKGMKCKKIKEITTSKFIEEILEPFAEDYFSEIESLLYSKEKSVEDFPLWKFSDGVINKLLKIVKEIDRDDILTDVYLLLKNQALLIFQNRFDGLKGFEELIAELFVYYPEEGVLYTVKSVASTWRINKESKGEKK